MAPQYDSTVSYHQLGSHCVVPGFAGSFGGPVAVPESNADLAGCFAVSVPAGPAVEEVQIVAEPRRCGPEEALSSVVKQHP